jgi:chromosome segregation ATPase
MGTTFAWSPAYRLACRTEIISKENCMFEENALFEISEASNSNGADHQAAILDGDLSSVKTGGQDPAGWKSHAELDSQANLLFGLIRDFKSLAGRACDAALREALHASKLEEMAGAELISLRLQLKEKIDALDASDRTLREREAIAKEKIDTLEAALKEKEEQLENCQNRARTLLGEVEGLNGRLNEAASAMKQAEARFRDFAEQQQGRISFLRQELKSKENLLQAKEDEMRQLGDESRLAISSLEERLQAIDAVLQIKDTELRDKQTALETNAAHEKVFAQLMQQLAVESQALMSELWEKNELVAELENKTYCSFDNGFASEQNGALQERLL